MRWLSTSPSTASGISLNSKRLDEDTESSRIQLYCPGSWEAGATLVVTAMNTFFPITIPLCVPKLICAARLLTCTLLEVQEI